MKVLVISDAHIIKTGENDFWCDTAVHGYDFWKRYLEVFEEVHVIARVQKLPRVPKKDTLIKADGEGVFVHELPFIRGFSGYISNFFMFKKAVKNSISDEDVAILRVPSLPSFILLHFWKKSKKPYAFEIIVDPEDCYRENKIAQKLFMHLLSKESKKANGVSYVTQSFLERKYPSYSILHGESGKYFDEYYSSINLDKDFFGNPRNYDHMNKINLVHVASAINSDVKGHSTLIKTVKDLVDRGVDVTLNCVGSGDMVEQFKEMASNLGISNHINFLGLFSSKNNLRKVLVDSDIFIFPSRAEGLPRAVIEAMAVGLPCLSTPVNGIPELIPSKYLFDPNDFLSFSKKIRDLMDNPQELSDMSSENILKAQEYTNDILENRRNSFYGKLRNIAERKERLLVVKDD